MSPPLSTGRGRWPNSRMKAITHILGEISKCIQYSSKTLYITMNAPEIQNSNKTSGIEGITEQ